MGKSTISMAMFNSYASLPESILTMDDSHSLTQGKMVIGRSGWNLPSVNSSRFMEIQGHLTTTGSIGFDL